MINIDRRISKTKKLSIKLFYNFWILRATRPLLFRISLISQMWDYCHYESKELLLDELCRYLFHHLFEREHSISTEDYLANLFQYFQKNQDHVTSLLLSKNDYFIRQLRKELEHDVYPMVADELIQSYPNIPHSYLKHLVVSHFIETLS